MQVIMYINRLGNIGGVETFVQNFVKRMSNKVQLRLLVNEGDDRALLRAAQWCPVEKIDRIKTYEADVVVMGSSWGYKPERQFRAEQFIQVIHADYVYYKKFFGTTYEQGEKTTHHVAVSKTVAERFRIATGLRAKVIYNMLDPEDNQYLRLNRPNHHRKLRLATYSRFAPEKGFDRMVKMADRLKIGYQWDVYGDRATPYGRKIISNFDRLTNVRFMGYHEHPVEVMGKYDYTVILSDTEGCPYTLLESLQVGTPVICTNFDSAKEFIQEGVNGWKFEFDLRDFTKEQILPPIKINMCYEELSSEIDWLQLFGSKKLTPTIKPTVYMVRARKTFIDAKESIKRKQGEEFEVSRERAEELLSTIWVEFIAAI